MDNNPAPPKKSNFGVILIVILAVVAIGGYFAYQQIYQQAYTEASPKPEANTSQVPTQPKSRDEQIADLKERIKNIDSVPAGFRGMALGKAKADLEKLEKEAEAEKKSAEKGK